MNINKKGQEKFLLKSYREVTGLNIIREIFNCQRILCYNVFVDQIMTNDSH